jgi:hypothetical protein
VASIPSFDSFSSQAIIRLTRTFPIFECLISSNWKSSDTELIQVLVARQQTDGAICFGSYLIDRLCLGVKNTMANEETTLS